MTTEHIHFCRACMFGDHADHTPRCWMKDGQPCECERCAENE